MDGGTHRSVGSIPPSISEKRESDPDKDDAERGTDALTVEDVEPATTETTLDAGECPWCEEGPFGNARSHAAQMHPERWQEYKEE